MIKEYQIFEWISGIKIIDQANSKHQTEDDEIASTHGDEYNYDITKNVEEEKITEEEEYDQEEQDE